MKLLCTGNCAADGLAVFLRRALPEWEIRHLPFLATFFGEFSEEFITQEHAWADLVFFHHKADNPQNYPTKNPKIPLAVWYQSGPFIIHATDQDWLRLLASCDGDKEKAIQQAPYFDMGYQDRWNHCLERMVEKEENEEVPTSTRLSGYMESSRLHQAQLTCNHPTSYIFAHWALHLINYIGAPVNAGDLERLFNGIYQNLNIAGLPCEESATSAAREILGLHWGGRPEDDESGRQVARERLANLSL
jgi:hypothetical protein